MSNKHGGSRPNSGRKPKVEEARIRDLVSPFVDGAIQAVVQIMLKGEKEADRLSAAKLILAYGFGQPSQAVDHTTKGEAITPQTKVMYQEDANAIIALYENRDNRSVD